MCVPLPSASDHKPVSAALDVVCRPQRSFGTSAGLSLVLLEASCTGMMAADLDGKSDPYFLVRSPPESLILKPTAFKSAVKPSTLTPRYAVVLMRLVAARSGSGWEGVGMCLSACVLVCVVVAVVAVVVA